MRGVWRRARLRHHVTVNPSVPAETRDAGDAEIPFFPMEAIGEFSRVDRGEVRPVAELLTGYSYLQDGDVAFAKVTPCFENGKGWLSTELGDLGGFATTELTVLRANSRLDRGFLAYLLQSSVFRGGAIASMTGAGGLKRVSDSFVRDFEFLLPPRDEQQAIADFLDRETAEIDAFIADQERLIELLNERRGAIFAHATAPADQSWEKSRLGRLVQSRESGVSVNGSTSAATLDSSELGVLKTGAASKGWFDATENKLVDDPVEIERLTCPVRAGRVIVNRANTPALVGAGAFVVGDYPQLFLSDKLWQLDLGGYSEFVAMWMQAPTYRDQVQLAAGGASPSMWNLSYEAFKDFAIAVPSTDEVRVITREVNCQTAKIDAAIADAREAIALSKERRAALISAAITGKINVRA